MENSIYPCLWFDGKAKEAAEFYCSVFGDSRITSDTPMVVTFELSGQKFLGLNGGPQFTINPSISFFVVCETEEETNKTWNKLEKGGTVLMPLEKYHWSERYGWLQDRYGVSWQLSWGKIEDVGQKITPSLLFSGDNNGKAEEAMHFYTLIFKGSSIVGIYRYGKDDQDVEGNVAHEQFTLCNQVFMAMDSSQSQDYGFNEAISLVIDCKDQQQIDYYWDKLTNGGEESMCGWLKDRYGVSWQVVPSVLGELMTEPGRAEKVMQAFMKMKKLEIKKLVEA
jgi:predicted 3-demethylubiquinone-9 3-methyltransferase (glyoxalase superfamily)